MRKVFPYFHRNGNFCITKTPIETISLNRLDAMVQLRPIFTHLDALTDLDKSTFTDKLRGGVEHPPPESEAKAVNMTAKSTEIEDTDSFGDMSKTSKLLKAMREEPWQRLSWIDSEVGFLFGKQQMLDVTNITVG